MARYAAFLRAINVGGRVVKMDRLRALFEEMGFADVKTLIASGNVTFESRSRTSAVIEKQIEETSSGHWATKSRRSSGRGKRSWQSRNTSLLPSPN